MFALGLIWGASFLSNRVALEQLGPMTIVSVRVPDPQFEGQTKMKLGNSEVQGIVNSMVYEGLSTFFEENPTTANRVINKATQAARHLKSCKR